MILFSEDYYKYPSAIVDYETSNETFLRLASLYKSMGVKNAVFHLTLLQPELQGVDPHSEDLTDEQKIMIAMECKYNPWYYFREVVRIPPMTGNTPVPFRANRANISLIWAFFSNVDYALIQPRQTGKSVSTDTLMVLLLFILLSNTTINLITLSDTLRKKNVESIKRIRDLLPGYLLSLSREDANNQIEITYSALNNRYITAVGQNSEQAANRLGRGVTVPINHFDEGPFINYIDVTLPAALSSANAVRDEAERNGIPYGNIFTTTAGKKDDRSGRFMYDFIHAGAPWSEAFLDAKDKYQLKEMIRTNSGGRKVLINGTFSHRQLGMTDEWLFERIVETNSMGEKADRDYFNVWTSGTQSSPLSVELNEIIRNSEMEPLYNEITKQGYIMRWYIPEDEIETRMGSGRFVIGLDTSEAIGRDAISMVVSDIRDMATIATACVNETNLIHFAKFLGEFIIRFPNTILVPENKSTGQSILDSLMILLPRHGIDPFRRIYNRIVDEADERREDFNAISTDMSRRPEWVYVKYKKYFGFKTGSGNRDSLYGTTLQNNAKNAGHLVRDKALAGEIRGLVVKNGRIDHQASGHDDMVISWLLNGWFLTQTKNLEHYGINTSEVLSDKSNIRGKEESPEAAMKRREQERLRAEMESIYEQLKDTTDEFIATKLEHRLRNLDSKVIDLGDETHSIDALIQQAKENRTINARNSQRMMSSLNRASIWGR